GTSPQCKQRRTFALACAAGWCWLLRPSRMRSCRRRVSPSHLPLEVLDRSPEPLRSADLRLPTQQLPGPRDVRLALLWVVGRQRLVHERALAPGQLQDLVGELTDRDLRRVPDVHGQVVVGVEQLVDAVHQVGDVAEAPRLLAVAVDGEGLA